MKYDENEIEDLLESAFADLSVGIFRFCENGNHRKAYDALGVFLDLILEDRRNLEKKL